MTNLGKCKKYLNEESLAKNQTEYAESVIINKYAHYLGNRKVKKTPLPSNVNERISQEEICRMKRNSLYSISLFSRKWERYCISLYSLDLTCPSLSTLYLGSLPRRPWLPAYLLYTCFSISKEPRIRASHSVGVYLTCMYSAMLTGPETGLKDAP